MGTCCENIPETGKPREQFRAQDSSWLGLYARLFPNSNRLGNLRLLSVCTINTPHCE